MEGVPTHAPMSCLDSLVAVEQATIWTWTTKVVSVSQDYSENYFVIVCLILDIDECASSPCGDICVNTNGSFHCLCTSNTTLDADGRSCICKKPINFTFGNYRSVERYNAL